MPLFMLDDLLAYCCAEGRVCPQPREWHRLWSLLPDKKSAGRTLRPAPPLILSQWLNTNDAHKRIRLAEHIVWAAEHWALKPADTFLRNLPGDSWLYETSAEASEALRERRRQHREGIEAAHQRNRDARQVRREQHEASRSDIQRAYLASIDPALIAAYNATAYRVLAEPPFTMRIGKHCDELAEVLRQHGVRTAAFLTAYNPYSHPTAANANVDAQQRLLSELAASGYAYLPGEGVGDDPSWPPEPSVLAMGLTRAKAKEIGRRYGQNAIVWIGEGAVPELVLLVQPRSA